MVGKPCKTAEEGLKEIGGWLLDSFLLAFVIGVLYRATVLNVWDALLALACALTPVIVLIIVVQYVRRRRWEHISR